MCRADTNNRGDVRLRAGARLSTAGRCVLPSTARPHQPRQHAPHISAEAIYRNQGRRGSGSPRSGQYRPSAKAAVPGDRRAVRPSPARGASSSKHPVTTASAPCSSVAPPAGHLAAPGYASGPAGPTPARAKPPAHPRRPAPNRPRTLVAITPKAHSIQGTTNSPAKHISFCVPHPGVTGPSAPTVLKSQVTSNRISAVTTTGCS